MTEDGRAQIRRMQEKQHRVWCLGEAARRTDWLKYAMD